MAYALPSDVADGFRPLTDAEALVADTLLQRAEAILIARFPTLRSRVTAGTLTAQLVAQVEAQMVERVLRNPDGKRQESIDDYSWTRDTALSAGALYVSDAEVALLSPPVARSRSVVLRTHSTPVT